MTANYFDVLGARTELGRPLSAEEDRVPGGHPVIVLSHSFWERRMQSDQAIIGKTIRLSGQPFTIVGIMASGFVGTEPQIPDFWAPVTMRDAFCCSRARPCGSAKSPSGWPLVRAETDWFGSY